DQFIHHSLGERYRNREAVTGVVARLARKSAVDADYFAAGVYQWSSGVARIDGGVRLNQIADRVAVVPVLIQQVRQTATLCADDSRGHGEIQSERVADGENPLSDSRGGVVAERHRREIVAVDLENGDVRRGVMPDDLRREDPVVNQPDDDLFGDRLM